MDYLQSHAFISHNYKMTKTDSSPGTRKLSTNHFDPKLFIAERFIYGIKFH